MCIIIFPLLFIILFLFFSYSAYSRRMIQEYELYYRDQSGKIIIDAYKFNVVVTTYEVLLCKPHPLTTLYTHFNLHILLYMNMHVQVHLHTFSVQEFFGKLEKFKAIFCKVNNYFTHVLH